MKRKGFCIPFLKYLIIKVFTLMNIFQFVMRRKGFCILFLKYLTIKVFLIKMYDMIREYSRAWRCPGPHSELPQWLLSPQFPPPIVSVTHPCGVLWALVVHGGSTRKQEAAVSSWAVGEAQAGVPQISTEATPALCRGEWSGRRGGWQHLSGMSEVMVSRPLHGIYVDPPHTEVYEGQCA